MYLNVGRSKYDGTFHIYDITQTLRNTTVSERPVGNALGDVSTDNKVPQPTEKGKQNSMRDTDYMAAVNNGDMETAQKTVDQAAKEAGYSPVTTPPKMEGCST